MVSILTALAVTAASAAERKVDPTWLHRAVASVEGQGEAPGCRYAPVFGAGTPDGNIARGVARYGELRLAPGGQCAETTLGREEQTWFVQAGSAALEYAGERHPLRTGDFLYLPPNARYTASNPGAAAARIMVMGFRIPASVEIPPPPPLKIANLDEIRKQTVGGHPASALYQLMIGDRRSTRDRIAAGLVVTSLYVMDIAPGGTNFPHHHEREEEIYLLLDGTGDMVAGGGIEGVEGRHPAHAGDAYFYRLNCTVGFYNTGQAQAHILAVRSLFPFR